MYMNFRETQEDNVSKISKQWLRRGGGTGKSLFTVLSFFFFYSYFVFIHTQYHLGILEMQILEFHPML